MEQVIAGVGDTVSRRRIHLAVVQGFGAMVLFSLTVPMTKQALASMSPELLTASRVLIAGIGALFWLLLARPRRPRLGEWGWLLLGGVGVVAGFPYLLAASLTRVDAGTMGVVLAGLPLATTLAAVVLLGEKHPPAFWLCAVGGALALIAFYQQTLVAGIQVGEPAEFALLALATLCAAGIGYAAGARAAATLGGWPAICWMLVLYLPFSALAFGYAGGRESGDSGWLWLEQAPIQALVAIAYLALVSQWLAFRYWYGAMTVAGAGTISQLQLIQPFFTLGFSAWLLAQPVSAEQWLFAILVAVAVAGSVRYR